MNGEGGGPAISASTPSIPPISDNSSPTTIPPAATQQHEPDTDTVGGGDDNAIQVDVGLGFRVQETQQNQDSALEADGENPVANGDGGGGGGGEVHEWMPEGENESKRVKVYELQGSRWVDQGTAFCFGQFTDDVNDALLIARSESNPQETVLSTTIRSNDVYQRQQETLIVWTEPDGVDYALSFQDPDGCSEVWNFILEVQRHMNGGGEEHTVAGTSSPFIGPEPSSSSTTSAIYRNGTLPTPQLGNIPDIERAIKQLGRTQALKDVIAESIVHEEYIRTLIDLMTQAEDLESIENLHALCSLMLTILTMNDHHVFEHILDEELFFGVVGILEYDPEFPSHKANYRAFLTEKARFLQPVPIQDPTIQRKIHHTYRLQFLKDVVLARAIDDSTFNVMQAGIIFNQIDIITHIQHDPSFLRNIVSLYPGGANANPPPPLSGGVSLGPAVFGKSPKMDMGEAAGNAMNVDEKEPATAALPSATTTTTTTAAVGVNGAVNGKTTTPSTAVLAAEAETYNNRRQVIFLIQQLCAMGKSVQLPARMALFHALAERGILHAVQWALSLSLPLPESQSQSQSESASSSTKAKETKTIISAGGEILATILDHDVAGARLHVLRHLDRIDKGVDKGETLLPVMCRLVSSTRDLAIQSQIGDALKVFMELPAPEKGDQAPTIAGVKLPISRVKDDPMTEKFLDYFYKGPVTTLFRPFDDLPDFKQFKDPVLSLSKEKANVLLYLVELLSCSVTQHSFRGHFFILTNNMVPRVATLLKARDKHLCLVALRFFRYSLKNNNHNQLLHLLKFNVMLPILQLTLRESRRDNLLSSACLEFFESIRKDNIKELIQQCMTTHKALIEQLVETPLGRDRFTAFVNKWHMNNEPPPEETKETPTDGRTNSRLAEMEEDSYFAADDEDDEDDYIQSISGQWARGTSQGAAAPLAINSLLKRKRRQAVSGMPKGVRPPGAGHSRSGSGGPLSKLVDYGEDDDEDDEDDEEDDYDILSAGIASGQFTNPKFQPLHQQQKSKGAAAAAATPPLRAPTPTPSGSKLSSSSSSSMPYVSNSGGEPPVRPSFLNEDDEQDDLLESLVRGNSNSAEPQPQPAPAPPPPRLGDKRRRGAADDEDDDELEALSKAKRPHLNVQKTGNRATDRKIGDDPPGIARKVKLKLGLSSIALASAPMVTEISVPSENVGSEADAKDADTG